MSNQEIGTLIQTKSPSSLSGAERITHAKEGHGNIGPFSIDHCLQLPLLETLLSELPTSRALYDVGIYRLAADASHTLPNQNNWEATTQEIYLTH